MGFRFLIEISGVVGNILEEWLEHPAGLSFVVQLIIHHFICMYFIWGYNIFIKCLFKKEWQKYGVCGNNLSWRTLMIARIFF